jgi:type IV pilus assembly protein PilC
MMKSGVPILQSLDIVADTTGQRRAGPSDEGGPGERADGESLTRPLTEHPVFPPMVVQMMAVGEDTGRWTPCCQDR